MKSPKLTIQPVGRPALSQQTGHREDDIIVDCNFDNMRCVRESLVACIRSCDQWDAFNDVTHQNIPRNRTGVVAEILCVAGTLCGEWLQLSR